MSRIRMGSKWSYFQQTKDQPFKMWWTVWESGFRNGVCYDEDADPYLVSFDNPPSRILTGVLTKFTCRLCVLNETTHTNLWCVSYCRLTDKIVNTFCLWQQLEDVKYSAGQILKSSLHPRGFCIGFDNDNQIRSNPWAGDYLQDVDPFRKPLQIVYL